MFATDNSAKSSRVGFFYLKFNKIIKNTTFNNILVILKVLLFIFTISFVRTVYANDDVVRVGDRLQIGIPIIAGVISIIENDNDGTIEWAEGALWTAAATHTLKFAIDEERPNGNDTNSFPSGHTSAAFQGAAFLQMRYGWSYGLPAYAAASFVGYSRIDGEYHYLHDVVAGAALAVGIQYAITGMGMSAKNFFITPVVANDQFSLFVSMKY